MRLKSVIKTKKKVKKELITREALSKLSHAYQVRFACFCARQVLHLVKEKDRVVCEAAITTAEKWLAGEATVEECRANANAAYAYAAAAQAANAASAAAQAAQAANAAAYAASYAVYASAAAAASAATYAVYASANATYADAASATATASAAKDKQKLIDEQWDFYNDLLNIDKYLEDSIGLENCS